MREFKKGKGVQSHIFRLTSKRTNKSVYFVNLEDDITLIFAKRAQNVEQMIFVQQLATQTSKGETNHGSTAHVELTKTLP